MREIIKYRCKDCQEEIIIPKPVYELMLQRGESLPERCEECRQAHSKKIKEIKSPYFQVELEPEVNFASFDYYESAYTSHGDRRRHSEEVKPDSSGMRIRVTDEHIEQLYKKLENNQVVVFASPTGTGKSIYTLYRLIEKSENYSGDFVEKLKHQGQVIQTQPLSQAADRIPNTISKKLLGELEIGAKQTLGFRHRGKEKYDRHNLGVVVTDGSLRNWVREGHLGQYSLIMVDEAHKRSLNIDTLLLLLKYKLPLYPHLKVIISSATININEFKETFEKGGISVGILDLSEILKEERNCCVHYWKQEGIEGCDCWLCQNAGKREKFWEDKENPPQLGDRESQLPEAVADFVMEILKETKSGGILVFLPGKSVIEKAKKLIDIRKKEIDPREEISVITIYRQVGVDEVAKRFDQKGKKRRVLLTTDIAETSHTLDDLVYIIDSGYIKESQWDPETQSSSLPTIRHSQAGCRQRYGRVGRNQKGYAYCLYKKDEFENEFKQQTTPELFRSPFDDVLLNLRSAGVTEELSVLIGKQAKKGMFETEIERSSRTLKKEGFIDEKGNVTENGLEIFHIPKSSSEIALMNLADEQNCLMEMLMILCLMRTEEGAPRTGVALYKPLSGLFVWDYRWTARTKMNVWKIHQALKAGCGDDIDLIAKLAVCFLKAKEKGKEKEWALRHFVNYDLLEKCLLGEMKKGKKENERIVPEREELLGMYRIKTTKEEVREIDLGLLDRVRAVLTAVLSEEIIKLEKQAGVLTYQWKIKNAVKIGTISEYCAGDWQNGDRAILLTITKEKTVLNGYPELAPKASFMVRLSNTDRVAEMRNLFFDQKFPVGSWISVKQQNEKYFISRIIQFPPAIRIDYRRDADFEMFLKDSLRSSYLPKGETIYFCKELIDDGLIKIIEEAEAVWVDKRRSDKAKIIEWRKIDGILKAIIAPIDDLVFLAKIWKEKKIGEYLSVDIVKVVRDPNDKGGWILSRTEEGLEIPIEMGDMSFSDLGYGLEKIEGMRLELSIKNFEGVMKRPRLSNLDRVIKDLEEIKREFSQPQKYLEGYIEEIDVEEEKIIVVIPRDFGVIHLFEIKKSPNEREISTRDFSGFIKGEKVVLSIELEQKKKSSIKLYRPLLDYQIKSLPMDFEYEKEKNRLFFPHYMKENQLENWEVSQELKETIVKRSWRYAFNIKIAYRETYKILAEGEIIKGKILEEKKYGKYHASAGKVSGMAVQIEKDGVQFIGFLPISKIEKERYGDSRRIPEIGQAIMVKIIKVPSLNDSSLTFDQKEAG